MTTAQVPTYWWQMDSNIPNFGDELNRYIFNMVLGLQVDRVSIRKSAMIGAGSILDETYRELEEAKVQQYMSSEIKRRDVGDKIHVWGSGFLETGEEHEYNPRLEFHAVRGPLSASRINEQQRPEVLADPGLLANMLLSVLDMPEKEYVLGVMPNYMDRNHPWVTKMRALDDVTIINTSDDPLDVMDQMVQCHFILSSSLYGLIVCDSLDIPNQWIVLSDNIAGGWYKYMDYYLSIGESNPRPLMAESLELCDDRKLDVSTIGRFIDAHMRFHNPRAVKEKQDELLDAFPWELKRELEVGHQEIDQ